jgi:purine-cytosine permease-like protein
MHAPSHRPAPRKRLRWGLLLALLAATDVWMLSAMVVALVRGAGEGATYVIALIMMAAIVAVTTYLGYRVWCKLMAASRVTTTDQEPLE